MFALRDRGRSTVVESRRARAFFRFVRGNPHTPARSCWITRPHNRSPRPFEAGGSAGPYAAGSGRGARGWWGGDAPDAVAHVPRRGVPMTRSARYAGPLTPRWVRGLLTLGLLAFLSTGTTGCGLSYVFRGISPLHPTGWSFAWPILP